MLEQICALARQAGAVILSAGADKGVHQKSSSHDLVTEYDGRVQAFLQRELLALLPEAGFLGEEDGADRPAGAGDCRFIVDPIDGTTNFVMGARRSCTSIALERQGQVELGVVYNPYADELFYAQRGKGAWLNGRQLHLADCRLKQTVGLVGLSPYYLPTRDKTFRLARLLLEDCIDLHRSGSAALDLCDLAAGRAGVMYEYVLSPWDYAAGALIVKEAGGVVSDLLGLPLRYDQRSSLAAGTPGCHRRLLKLSRQVEEECP